MVNIAQKPTKTPEMDEYSSGRRKKSDKAREKAGRPSSKHVREYQKRIDSSQGRREKPRHNPTK